MSPSFSIRIKSGNESWPTGSFLKLIRDDPFGPAFILASSGYASQYPTAQDAIDDIDNYGKWIPIQFEVINVQSF